MSFRQLIDRSTLHWRSLVTWRGLVAEWACVDAPQDASSISGRA